MSKLLTLALATVLVALPSLSDATISVLTAVNAPSQISATSNPVVTTAAIPAHALIIVTVTDTTAGGPPAGGVADTAGNTYTLLESCQVGADYYSPSIGVYVAYDAIAMAAGGTVTYTPTASAYTAVDVTYAPGVLHTSNPFDNGACATGTGTSHASGTVTPSEGGELFFGAVLDNSWPITYTQSAGFTSPPLPVQAGVSAAGSLIEPARAAHNYSPTANSSVPFAAALLAFKAQPLPANASLMLVRTGSSGGDATSPTCSGVAPIQAGLVGYCTRTFGTDQFTTSNTDMGMTYASGFQWYPFNFFSSTPTVANVTINVDKSISIGQGGNNYSATMSSAGYVGSSPNYIGTAFGGGAYFEATFKFTAVSDPTFAAANGWPGWWANALEGNLGTSHWSGQAAGYLHYAELDFLEYFMGQYADPLDSYGTSIHEWYDIGPSGNQFESGNVTAASQASFSSYHRYGWLWVPATVSTSGYMETFYDGVSVARFNYTQFTTQSPPPVAYSSPWFIGVADQNHFVLQIGSNSTYPITLQSVSVWQASAAGNLVR